MPVLIPSLGVLVTAAPGAGSTSLREAFLAAPGARAVPEPPIKCLDGKHATWSELVRACWRDPSGFGVGARRPLVVTSTRNPWDHYASEWNRSRTTWAHERSDPRSWVHRVAGMAHQIDLALRLDLPGYVEALLAHDAEAGRTLHLNAGHVDEADVVLRVEHLAEDLRLHLPVPLPTVAHRNAGPPRAGRRDLFDARSQLLVALVHRPDLERFGYEF